MVNPLPNIVTVGEGTPLLFIHGNGVDHRLLFDLDDLFECVHGWKRIYVDLPGFGQTPPLPGKGGLAEIADWLNDVVVEVTGGHSFALIGNSLGGYLARGIAAAHREQCLGMALLAPVVNPNHSQRTLPRHEVIVADPMLLASLSLMQRAKYEEIAVVQTRENWEKFQRCALPGILAADPDAMSRINSEYILPTNPDEYLDNYRKPVLIVTGKQDAIVGYKDQWDLARTFLHSTYAALDCAGHNVHLDQPHQVRALLTTWLENIVLQTDIKDTAA